MKDFDLIAAGTKKSEWRSSSNFNWKMNSEPYTFALLFLRYFLKKDRI